MDFQIILDAIPEIITQLIAFLLVLFILKKYAFGPVFAMLDERQKVISGEIEEAKQSHEKLEILKKEYELKLQSIEQEGRIRIQDAIQAGQKIAAEIAIKANADAQKQVERAKQDIAQEVDKAREVMRRQVVELSTQIAQKLIEKNLSDAENQKFIEAVLSQTGA